MRLQGRRRVARGGGPKYSARLHDLWRLPGAIENRLLAPIGADVEREVAVWSGEPVALLVLARGFCARIKRERAVGISLERPVLRPERIALQIIWMEEVLGVVQRQ
jgi:hypothetical protein